MDNLESAGTLDLADQRLEYRLVGPQPSQAPCIVMLHEGLGSVGLWGDFPDKLQAATATSVLAYSRAGYGRSSPAPLPRPLDFMEREAREVLPRLLDRIGFRRGLLFGHSDGASIAAIYAGSVQDYRVRGLVLIAPHFFTEDMGLAEIARAKAAFEAGELRTRLERWHDDVDATFGGWSRVWLDPEFRKWDITEELAYIRVPVLIVQGEADQYGTVRQIEVARQACTCPIEVTLLPGVRHSPHREVPEVTLAAVAGFANHLLDERY
jgi:pimeloyl-ACP methyl ester carboxylesterase